MKLISLWQPWASLMATGAKRIETRSWATSYRGRLAIHASKGGLSKRGLAATLAEPEFEAVLGTSPVLPFGCIVAVVELVDCVPTSFEFTTGISRMEYEFGDYSAGRYAWITDDLFRLPEPIPFKASQGLCDVTPEVLSQLREQWKAVRP